MNRLALLAILTGFLLVSPVYGQSREEKVRNDKVRVEAEGYWIYNDLPQAISEAKKSGKPIIAVLRCLPCEECVKLDDDLIDADQQMKPLLEKFVRVRIVSTNGLDLSLFQFDTDQSFAVFLFHPDGTIYGRFGTRSSRTEWASDVSIPGLAKALEGALELHKNYPANKSALAAKRGPAPEYPSPEKFPTLEKKYKSSLDYSGKVVQSCIHCHQIGDALRQNYFNRKQQLPEGVLFPYPHPKSIGLILDPKERATVLKVESDTPASRSEIKAGDVIQTINGQPMLSFADVQWVLQQTAPEGGELAVELLRRGKSVRSSISLASGWRRRDDIAWRASTWELRRILVGGIFSAQLPEEELKDRGLPAKSTALLVKHVGQYAPHDVAHRAGVRKGDIIVAINSRTDILRETDWLADRVRTQKPGDQLKLKILREGKQQELTVVLP